MKEFDSKEFKKEYMLDSKVSQKQKTTCRDCIHFGPLPENDFNKSYGCTVSYLEAKYGTANTPSCSDFIAKQGVESKGETNETLKVIRKSTEITKKVRG